MYYYCPARLLCTEESVLELLAGLDISKSIGSDGISPKMLKSTPLCVHCYIIMQVVQPLNIYWHVSHFMETWKNYPNSQRHKQVPSCYRPISAFLPVVSKLIEHHVKAAIEELIEHHVKAAIEEFLQVNAPISSSQWGFTSNRFTVSVLIRVLDDWQCALDQGNEVCIVFFLMCPII